MPRSILHIDMDAFFASVEQLDKPELRGRPVLVGGAGKRGVIAAASYEARVFGCRSAMPTAVALRLCPHAVVVGGRGARYRELSEQVFGIFEDFTPCIQPLSIDEAFLDVTGSERLLGSPVKITTTIRARIKAETGLTASVGVAPNKFLAKLASDLKKPDALVVIEPGREQQILDPLPVSKIPGIGDSATRRLERLGVRTIAQLRQLEQTTLKATFGSWGERLGQLARGIDDRPVVTDRHAKSVGHETTFPEDLTDADQVRSVLFQLTEDAAWRLRRKRRRARTVTCKIRYGHFETITRAHTLNRATDSTSELWQAAQAIFDSWAATSFRPVRLIGVSTSGLTDEAEHQLELFADPAADRQHAIDAASDAVAAKFGKGTIRRARAIDNPA